METDPRTRTAQAVPCRVVHHRFTGTEEVPAWPQTSSRPAPRRGKGRKVLHDQDEQVSRSRAGAPRRQGRVQGPEGPFSLAVGLTAPGDIPLDEAIALACAELERQGRERMIDEGTAYYATVLARNLAAFAALRGVTTLGGIDQDLAELYVHAPHSRTSDGQPGRATDATKHTRRGYMRQIFKVCRLLGLLDGDPTADIVLPPRPRRFVRPLTDEEVQRCKDAVFRTTDETKLPCALALALSGVTNSEMPQMSVDDVWLDARRAWAHGGGARALPRWVELDDWAASQVGRRLDWLAVHPPTKQEVHDCPRVLVYQPRKVWVNRHKKQCAVGNNILKILRLAGLGDLHGVRPQSIREWHAAKIYEQTGSIEHVAARLGMVSLDAAADMLGLDWTGLYDIPGPPGVPDPVRRLDLGPGHGEDG